MEKETDFCGKITKCVYCSKEMSFFAVIKHEDRCRKIKKLCDGYGNCKNKGIIMLDDVKEKSRWCFECFKRFKKEHPQINFEVSRKVI